MRIDAHAQYSRGVIGHFVRRRLEFVSCFFVLLIMPPSKVCPQCKAVVPLRLKVCISCEHVPREKPGHETDASVA